MDSGFLLFTSGAYFIKQGCKDLTFVDKDVNLNL